MPSEFTSHFTRTLELANSRPVSRPPSPAPSAHQPQVKLQDDSNQYRKEDLHALLASINQGSISTADVKSYVHRLRRTFPGEDAFAINVIHDEEVATLEEAILGKLTIALYSNALDVYLSQAADVEAEAEWWAEVERSRANVVLYFVQTLPLRFFNVLRAIIQRLRRNGLPITLSNLSPSSIQALFPSSSQLSLRPGLLATTFFPYLKQQQSLTLAVLLSPPTPSPKAASRFQKIRDSVYSVYRLLTLPLHLTRQECRYNRKALERIRDERADCLGQLAKLRTPLSSLIRNGVRPMSPVQYTTFLNTLSNIVAPSVQSSASATPLLPLTELAQNLPSIPETHLQRLRTQNLLRPSPLTRAWPSLLMIPPLFLYVYANRKSWTAAIVSMADDSKETIRGFVRGWLMEPLIGVINTVRAGGKGDMLVREEGVVADLESLERMALALARDALKYTPAQLEQLSAQVKIGDLTPVMQIYEEDIRTPFRSALTGTLLRNLFIQIQKAKVDIDQALSGIDRLLKSQELTFAFVGVAPALAVVYAVLGSADRVWCALKGTGSRGGKQRKKAVWEGMRRIERLLILHPTSDAGEPIGSLSTGLLILSLTRLRSYALDYLPSRVRAPFLADLGDLEDTNLDRDAKLRIVGRMWRCWGPGGEGIIKF